MRSFLTTAYNMMRSNKTGGYIVTGSWAKKAAKDGAKIVVAAKTADPHPKLPGTIYTAAEEIVEAGGEALPVICDIRNEDNVRDAVNKSVDHFGGIDICINNASAIQLTNVTDTEMKRYEAVGIKDRINFLIFISFSQNR